MSVFDHEEKQMKCSKSAKSFMHTLLGVEVLQSYTWPVHMCVFLHILHIYSFVSYTVSLQVETLSSNGETVDSPPVMEVADLTTLLL